MADYDKYRRKKKKSRFFDIVTLVAVLIMVCCAHAGAINPQQFFLAPFMSLAYMPMLILVLVLLLMALIWRKWLSVLLVVIGLVATATVIKLFVPLNSGDDKPAIPADTTLILNVMTYNVLGFNYNEPSLSAQPSASIRLILDANPDVVLLQEGSAGGLGWDEIPSVKPQLPEVMARYPYCYNGNEGLNIMSKYPFTTQPVGKLQHSRTPLSYNREQTSYLARAFDLTLPSGKQLRLVDFRLQSYHLGFGKSATVRVSPDVKPSSMERMRRSFALRSENAAALRQAFDESPENLIVCGDMNDITASYVYRVIRGNDLNDAWSDAGTGYAPTYNRHHLPYRIDHVFYRGDVRPIAAQRLTGGSSDHYPLMVSFDIDITDNH